MRGRSIVALLLFGFVLVTTGVIWRRSLGYDMATELKDLRERRDALDAQQAALEGAIRDASSRARLARTAEERLGMRVPPESLVIRLPRPVPEKPKQ
ncbi:MAG: cell division protein FtsL [Gemmatimonadetes bacterium]|jgi:cell division protein FtsL|nr:cell division protein FtsL [Gemmatimonadota bacterium]MBP7549199.1 cell division protein FtsL [Gemmatimonadaceae bacterium]